jgi:predicted neuraminidase
MNPKPKVVEGGSQRMAIEGLAEQVIQYSTSLNGVAWSKPLTAALGQEGAVWSPVLHTAPDGNMLLFYTESHACFRPTSPKTYMPGGSIKMIKITILTGRSVIPMRAVWGEIKTLREQTETQMPWVIANKLLVASNGDWILPMWQEYTFHYHLEMMARGEKFKDGVKRDLPTHCDPVKMFSKGNSAYLKGLQDQSQAMADGDEAMGDGDDVRETVAGVLVSDDAGATWSHFGKLTHPKSHVLEGTVIEVPVSAADTGGAGDTLGGAGGGGLADGKVGGGGGLLRGGIHGGMHGGIRAKSHPELHSTQNVSSGATELLMLFRSSCGCLMKSTSPDYGRTWTPLQHTILPNPNTKADMLRLRSGHVVLAFNNHKQRSRALVEGCRMCRTHLHLAISDDHGNTFKWTTMLDDTEELNYRVHYPTLLEVNSNSFTLYPLPFTLNPKSVTLYPKP